MNFAVILPGPPEINDGLPISATLIGETVTLTCKSYGKEAATEVVWYRRDSRAALDTTYNQQVCSKSPVTHALSIMLSRSLALSLPLSFDCSLDRALSLSISPS